MTDPIKKKPTIKSATILALEQIVEDRQARYDNLQDCRSLLVGELEATQRELATRISQYDKEILEAQAELEEARVELAKHTGPAGQVQGSA